MRKCHKKEIAIVLIVKKIKIKNAFCKFYFNSRRCRYIPLDTFKSYCCFFFIIVVVEADSDQADDAF